MLLPTLYVPPPGQWLITIHCTSMNTLYGTVSSVANVFVKCSSSVQDPKHKRLSNLSIVSSYSGFNSIPGDRSSVSSISSTGTLGGVTFGDSPESTLKRDEHMFNHDATGNNNGPYDDSTLKRQAVDSRPHGNSSTSPPDFDPEESFKIFNTPL